MDELNELFDKIRKYCERCEQTSNEAQKLVADTRTELKVTQQRLVKLEAQHAALERRWGKAQTIFAKIGTLEVN